MPRSKFHHENTQPILRTRGTHTQDCFLPVPLHLAPSTQQVPYYSDIHQVVAKFSTGRRAQKLTPKTILLTYVSASLLAIASRFVRVDATGSCGWAQLYLALPISQGRVHIPAGITEDWWDRSEEWGDAKSQWQQTELNPTFKRGQFWDCWCKVWISSWTTWSRCDRYHPSISLPRTCLPEFYREAKLSGDAEWELRAEWCSSCRLIQ